MDLTIFVDVIFLSPTRTIPSLQLHPITNVMSWFVRLCVNVYSFLRMSCKTSRRSYIKKLYSFTTRPATVFSTNRNRYKHKHINKTCRVQIFKDFVRNVVKCDNKVSDFMLKPVLPRESEIH
jgi:hypothetical protein